MLYFWHWWLLVAIMSLFYTGVHAYSDNLCSVPHSNGLRTWGRNCQHMCHCVNEEACNSGGYCANGCTRGWTRLTPTGSCSIRTLNNTTPTVTLLAVSNYNNNGEIRDERDAFLERSTPINAFFQDDVCNSDETGVKVKSARITANPPILLGEFTVIFKVQPRKEDSIKATFSVRNSEHSVTQDLKQHLPDTENMLSVKFLQYVLVDFIKITLTTITAWENCTQAAIDGFVLVGKPICPYGKWGIRCERNCHCQCRFSECHPTSGRCLEKGFVCPVETFGQLCSNTCSSECFGSPRECHPLTGECKVCQHQNMTGVSCRSPRPQEEMIHWHDPCTDAPEDENEYLNSSTSVVDLQKSTLTQRNRYGVAIIVLVFLILFTIICCCYVQTVQYCAKRRMRDQMLSLEEARRRQSSMATYTEFKKEFVEMETMRKANLAERIRAHEEMTMQNSQDKQVSCASKNQMSTSHLAAAEPRTKASTALKIRQSSSPL